MSVSEIGSAVEARDALDQLGRVLESPALGEKSRLRPLLRYLVSEELEGRGEEIKAYSIAVDVFGRGEDFDPRSDSIVRVEANRLRQSLSHYYATFGLGDAVRISIPRGQYRPHFERMEIEPPYLPAEEAARPVEPTPAAPVPPADPKPQLRTGVNWKVSGLLAVLAIVLIGIGISGTLLVTDQMRAAPAVAEAKLEIPPLLEVAAFSNQTNTDDFDYLADGLLGQLIADLSHVPTLRVRVAPSAAQLARRPGLALADYRISGRLTLADDHLRLHITLVNAESLEVLWSNYTDVELGSEDLHSLLNDSLRIVVERIAGPNGSLNAEALRALDRRVSAREEASNSAYHCLLYWYAFDARKVMEYEGVARNCLAKLTADGTKDGAIWAAYSMLLLLDWTKGENSEDDGALDSAVAAAEQAIALDPMASIGHEYMGAIAMARGQLDRALSAYQRSLELNPSKPDLYVSVGWNYILRGNWEEGIRYVEKGVAMSPTPPGWFRIPLSMDAFRLGYYERAQNEADLILASGDKRGLVLALAAAQARGDQESVDEYKKAMVGQWSWGATWAEAARINLGEIQAIIDTPDVLQMYRFVLFEAG